MSDDQDEAVELDGSAKVLLDAYEEAEDAERQWRELKEKARDQLLSYLSVHDAVLGTIDGQPAVSRSHVEQNRMDTKRFREDEPALYDAYAKTVSFWRLFRKRPRGGRRGAA